MRFAQHGRRHGQEESPGRLGPRPLPLHLTLAAIRYASSNAALPLLKSGLLPWNQALRGKVRALAGEAERVAVEDLVSAVDREARRRLDLFLTGIALYRSHPYVRSLPSPKVVWSHGSTSLLDYGGRGKPILVVPSLVNRAYILDLGKDVSLMRRLVREGLRPFLVDWGRPAAQELGLTLTDYVRDRLCAALDAVRMHAMHPVSVIGYCMGGLLALGLAQFRSTDVERLALLATPWDFHVGRETNIEATRGLSVALEPVIAATGMLDVEILQAMFASLDPFLNVRKFTAFAGRDQASEEAAHFVAIEDWANDGVPLTGPVARECLGGWYGANTPMCGQWRIAGVPVEPARIGHPTLLVIPARDRIVPPASAAALAARLPSAVTIHANAGHIGMVAGRHAARAIWPMLASWLHAREPV